MIKRILVVGGANGIGLSIATEFAKREEVEKVYIVDKAPLSEEFANSKFEVFQFDLTEEDYSFFDRFTDVNALMITAGFGPVLRLVHKFYDKLEAKEDFYCGVMVSIAGFMSSPFFAVYGATKAALKIFIESVNVELEKAGSTNRILNVSPGSIKGTSFNSGKTDLSLTMNLANEILCHLDNKDDLFIPQYESIFKNVLARYHEDFREEGRHSYDYKLNSGRLK